MSQIISKFPAMMLGFIGENDLKILEYDEDIVVFESANDIEQPFDLTLCIFDLPSYDYKEYCFRNCILQKKYQSTYSYIFHVQLPEPYQGSMFLLILIQKKKPSPGQSHRKRLEIRASEVVL